MKVNVQYYLQVAWYIVEAAQASWIAFTLC